MPEKMSDAQAQTFIGIASLGMACGLEHPFEWLANYLTHIGSLEDFDHVPQKERDALDAYAAFLRLSVSCPGDPWEQMTADGVITEVNGWYAQKAADHKEKSA